MTLGKLHLLRALFSSAFSTCDRNRVRGGGRFMRAVGPILDVNARSLVIGAVLAAEALPRCPGLNLDAVDGEVIVRHEALDLLEDGRESVLQERTRRT